MSTMNQVYSDPEGKNVGVDVGKSQLDICIHESALHWSADNTAAGIRALVVRLARYKLARIVVEATGDWRHRCMKTISGLVRFDGSSNPCRCVTSPASRA